MTHDSPLPLARPSFDSAELDAVEAVFESGWLAGQGPVNRRFEEAFAHLSSTEHTVAVSNCTAALHLAMIVLGAGPGDEVVVADYTYPATGHSVMYSGARPVFADVDAITGMIDPVDVEAAITHRTVGIIGVDNQGQCADWDALGDVARRHGLFLVEDAACSAGATFNGRPAGSLADIGCFSLHARKGITSGEGGVLVTDNAEWAKRARSLSAFGTQSAWSRKNQGGLLIPSFVDLGYNYKLSDLQAAVALVQLGKLGDFLEKRRRIAGWYAAALGGVPGVTVPTVIPGRSHTWQTYAVTLDDSIDRGAVAAFLREHDIGANIGTFASHLQPVYGSTRSCPNSARLFHTQLALPMYTEMAEESVALVAEVLGEAIRHQREATGR